MCLKKTSNFANLCNYMAKNIFINDLIVIILNKCQKTVVV